MVVTSHAKCRKCGGARHKIARFNMCEQCWRQIKPQVRDRWRQIKERRRLRREVDDYISNEQRKALRPEVAAVAELTAQEQARREIEEIKKNGVPPVGTKERARYLQLSIVAKHGSVSASRARAGVLEQWEQLLGWAYIETDAPVSEIYRVFRADQNRLNRVRRVLGLKSRNEMKPWRPKVHLVEGEELLLDAGQLYLRNGTTGLQRRIYPVAEELPELPAEPSEEAIREAFSQELPEAQEPIAIQEELVEHTQEELPEVATAPEPAPENGTVKRGFRRRGKNLRPAEKQEILRLYQDSEIPVDEIKHTYDVSDGTIYRLIKEAKIPSRRVREAQANLTAPMPLREVSPFNVVPKNFDTSLAVAPPQQTVEHAWFVRYTLTRSTYLGGSSLEDVVRKLREQAGDDVEIIQIQRS